MGPGEGVRGGARPRCSPTGARRRPSDVDDDVTLWPGAADQHVPLRRRIEWIGLVGDGAGDQSALAVVTDTGPARPAHGHVAGFGQLEETLLLRGTPPDGESAPGEGDEGPRSLRVGWRMG